MREIQQRRSDQAEQLVRALGGDEALLVDPSTLAAGAGVLDRALPSRADGWGVDTERIDASGAARVAELHHHRSERLEPPVRGMEEGVSNGLYLLVRAIDPHLVPTGAHGCTGGHRRARRRIVRPGGPAPRYRRSRRRCRG